MDWRLSIWSHTASKIDDSVSKLVELKYGLPQCSVLGPILFILYTSPLDDICRKYGVKYHCYVDLHWVKVNEHIIFKVAVFMYKCVISTAPKYLSNLVNKSHGRPLHSSTIGLLPISKCNTTLVQNSSFSSMGPKISNGLPQSIRHATSLDQFKGLLRTFLFKRSYDL